MRETIVSLDHINNTTGLSENSPEIRFLYADSGLDSEIFPPKVIVDEVNKYCIDPEAYAARDPLFLAASLKRLFRSEW